jgi:ATP-dependent 26S proteasome regulatory subunit
MEQIQPIMYMLLGTLKNKEKQNNFIEYITLFIIFIPIIVKFLPLQQIENYFNNLFTSDRYITVYIQSHEVPIHKSFSNVLTTKLVYSEDFLSVMHYLSSNINKFKNLDVLTEVISNNTSCNKKKKENEFMYLPVNNKKMLISDKIYFELNEINNENNSNSNNNNNNDNKNNTFTVKSKYMIKLSIEKKTENGIDIILNFIKECKNLYNIFLDINNIEDNLYIFEYKGSEKIDNVNNLIYKEHISKHNKDLLTNVFIQNKQNLIDYIDPFIYTPYKKDNDGKEMYKKLGNMFRAGLFFYGAPGTGKTSTIKAILKYTKRHGLIINLGKIKTNEELEDVFRDRKINNRELKNEQLCFILDDCDASVNNIIKSRKINDNTNLNTQELDISKLLGYSKINTNPEKNNLTDNNDSVNLSCFLNIIDGLIELDGIMIIMTTNHPEKIDEALIRPGRFDFKYEFKNATNEIVKQMVQCKFNLTNEEIQKYTELNSIKDEILSPAEVQSICLKNKDIKKCVEDLLFECQK